MAGFGGAISNLQHFMEKHNTVSDLLEFNKYIIGNSFLLSI